MTSCENNIRHPKSKIKLFLFKLVSFMSVWSVCVNKLLLAERPSLADWFWESSQQNHHRFQHTSTINTPVIKTSNRRCLHINQDGDQWDYDVTKLGQCDQTTNTETGSPSSLSLMWLADTFHQLSILQITSWTSQQLTQTTLLLFYFYIKTDLCSD